MPTTETTYDSKVIAGQLLKLAEYLRIPPHTMVRRCGLTDAALIKKYSEGLYSPTMATINKILKRYPVTPDWLLRDKGMMWKEDYFEGRFKNYTKNPKTPSEKLKALLEITEASLRQISSDTTISLSALYNMKNVWEEVPHKIIMKFRSAYPFIPYEFWK